MGAPPAPAHQPNHPASAILAAELSTTCTPACKAASQHPPPAGAENTLEAFESAAEVLGASPHGVHFELDVQLTRDGECVVLHDERWGA